MKQIAFTLFILFVILISLNSLTSGAFGKTINLNENKFQLHYMNIGYGTNRFKQQPIFKVNDQNYIYSLEDVWLSDKWKPAKPDTISMGHFRQSSIDSIINLISGIKDSVVFRMSSYFLGTGSQNIDISYGKRKILFRLDGAFDSTAQKIVNILNSYVPTDGKKLWISQIESKY